MFAELQCKSHYSFLDGASSPEELVQQASANGYEAIAITDECSYAGLVKAYSAARHCKIKLIVGSQFSISHPDGHFNLVLLAKNMDGYSSISNLISRARRRSDKGEYTLSIDDLRFGLQNCLAIWLPNGNVSEDGLAVELQRIFKQRLWIGVGLFKHALDQVHYSHCYKLSTAHFITMVACNDVVMHCKTRKPMHDTVTAIRFKKSVRELGKQAVINAEQHLRSIDELYNLYPGKLLEESLRIAAMCNVNMADLRYQYPKELVPEGMEPPQYLRQLTEAGAKLRWPEGIPGEIAEQIETELEIIEKLRYEYYFLTVYDIVSFARAKGILCQGRGSAANSVVCYCLFITSVDPSLCRLLFARFISDERNEPPDIDVDFESDRREDVIQYIYQKYSRKRAAIAATVITYRRRSAVRDVAKALGLSEAFAIELNKSMAWWDDLSVLQQTFVQKGVTFSPSLVEYFFRLVKQIIGVPRHLSQHVGGFIITAGKTSNLVPVENAAMPERTIIQWDKTDIEILGLLKVDVLGLGMLGAIQKCFTMVSAYTQEPVNMQTVPKEVAAVYDMLCAGDSIGVFQVESRAQMSMLPRLKPRSYYDLVIEVAIVRPGPIQGDMVHPYLRRRNGEEAIEATTPEIEQVLEKTYGVPIFQEQVIELTMVAAGFSGGEADQLRRAMASWGKRGDLSHFEAKLINGMLANGHSEDFAKRIFRQIQGFGSYGFPESHSASFALLVYVSAWLKRFHPAAFYASILNSQPMGFYSPSQLVQDARRHNIRVLPVCILNSDWQHGLDFDNRADTQNIGIIAGLRLGLRLVTGLSESAALNIEKSRREKPFVSIQDFKSRKLVSSDELMKLVGANAFACFDRNRNNAYWASLQIDDGLNTQSTDRSIAMKAPTPSQALLADHQYAKGVSLEFHPMQLLRGRGLFQNCTQASSLLSKRNNSMIQIAGVVTGRQRPGTASGVIFLTLEDETGNINVVVWRNLQERFKQTILGARILLVKGKLEHQHGVANVIAGYIEDHTSALPGLGTKSRNFH